MRSDDSQGREKMRGTMRMALGALFVLFAVGTIGTSAAVAEEDVKMVFDVEGMT
jgi:hypothetical protein